MKGSGRKEIEISGSHCSEIKIMRSKSGKQRQTDRDKETVLDMSNNVQETVLTQRSVR